MAVYEEYLPPKRRPDLLSDMLPWRAVIAPGVVVHKDRWQTLQRTYAVRGPDVMGLAREARIADLKVLAEQIQRVTVTIEANANEEGHLYGSVGAPEIAKALKSKNLNVEPDMIRLEGPIKEIALYAVKINLGYETETEVKVLVVRPTEKK